MRLRRISLDVERQSIREEHKDFLQSQESIEEVFQLWDKNKFEKEQLEKSLEELEKNRTYIDAQLELQIKKSRET